MKIKELNYGGMRIPLSNLVIVVGPNGSGKTTLLADLQYQYVRSTPSNQASIDTTKWRNLLRGDFLEASEAEWREWHDGLMKIDDAPVRGDNGVSFSIKENLSHDEKGEWLDGDDKNNLSNALSSDIPINLSDLHTRFGASFKSQQSYHGTVDNRLWISKNASGPITTTRHSSQLKAAPYLATNKDALAKINRVMRRLFGKQLFAESHNYPNYALDIAKDHVKSPKRASSTTDGLLKNKQHYADWRRDNDVQDISTEGHGVRATSELLYALENKSKKINFIDEPELHLYPATKYSLGKIISNYSNKRKQTILVTHDTEMLRGLVYSNKKATVVRVSSRHELSYVSASTIGKAYSSDILQGAFQDGVVIVEGITDKYVYSNAFSEKHLSDDYALQVVSMYGKGSLGVPIPFYESLKIKNAVIADFDITFPQSAKGPKPKDILEILRKKGVPSSEQRKVEDALDRIWVFMKGRANKAKGLNATGLTSDEKVKISGLIDMVKEYGLFIIPVGGLEDWINRPHGTDPETILAVYRSKSNSTYKPLTDFLSEVSNYVKG